MSESTITRYRIGLDIDAHHEDPRMRPVEVTGKRQAWARLVVRGVHAPHATWCINQACSLLGAKAMAPIKHTNYELAIERIK